MLEPPDNEITKQLEASTSNSSSDGSLNDDSSQKSAFEQAAQQRGPNVIVEFMGFLLHNKKWWLTPIILVLLVFSVFIALTSSALAPFIYVLF